MSEAIVIIGGGMAGLALAAVLAPGGWPITVLEQNEPSSPDEWPAAFDLRVSALTHASAQLLAHAGAWPTMVSLRVTPYQGMYVWDAEGTGHIEFDATRSGVPHLGHLVENRVTVQGLRRALQAYDNVRISTDTFERLLPESGRYTVELSSGQRLTPALVVGADGALSRVREQAGVPVRQWPYDQHAIVTTVHCEQPHRDTCWQIFTRSGPLALLPLRDASRSDDGHLCSIVWSQDVSQADVLMALDDAMFSERLTRSFEGRLGVLTVIDRRETFPLIQRHAVDYVRPGLALIGDAAHTIHPLAGQGINLGFMDVATLAEELLAARVRGLPLAHESVLRRYQRRRKAANLTMMAAMEAFKRGYGHSHWALQIMRNWGMDQANRHGLLKQWIVEHAMGLRGDIPEMALQPLRVTL